METAKAIPAARKPGTVPLRCAIAAYGVGVVSAGIAVLAMNLSSRLREPRLDIAFASAMLGAVIAAGLNGVAFFGGIWSIVAAVRMRPRAALDRPILGALMGLVGFVGVFGLLLLAVIRGT